VQELFDKYKNDEPAPDRSRPSFKEPRRVKAEYLHITGESPVHPRTGHPCPRRQ